MKRVLRVAMPQLSAPLVSPPLRLLLVAAAVHPTLAVGWGQAGWIPDCVRVAQQLMRAPSARHLVGLPWLLVTPGAPAKGLAVLHVLMMKTGALRPRRVLSTQRVLGIGMLQHSVALVSPLRRLLMLMPPAVHPAFAVGLVPAG